MSSPKVEQGEGEPNGESIDEKNKPATTSPSKWRWPKLRFGRDYLWYGIYYPGFLVLICVCMWLAFGNPDQVVWFGKVNFNPRLYASEADAEADNAEDIENVHRTFKIWFIVCALNLLCMMVVGLFKHGNKRYEVNMGDKDIVIVAAFYYVFAIWWLAMWGIGLQFRFQEAGLAACNDETWCDPVDTTCGPTELTEAEAQLIQDTSCNFMKYYLDASGLLIGGYAAWFILSLTGATKTPVWTPKDKNS